MTRALAALVALAACSSTPRPAETGEGAPIPASSRQLLLGVAETWDATTATLILYTRASAADPWRPATAPIAAVLGRGGIGWGRGLHGEGAAAGAAAADPVKREGDGRAPAGVFSLRGAYGYADAPPAGARVPYQPLTPDWRCVDDVGSAHYNRIVDQASPDLSPAPDWSSSEDMRRADDLYTWVIEIAHNLPASGPAVPGGGRCIFLHVWRGPDAPTAGCTAMSASDIEVLLEALDPAADPVYVLLPAPLAAAFAGPWQLPRP